LKLLLDTHVWLWALHDPSRLSHRVRDVLRNPANELLLSPVSTWEALLLNAKGKIRLPANLSEWLTAATAPLREAPLTHEIVLIAQQLPDSAVSATNHRR
jgi:PIN domain nuclease of toxin-antitoxin system